MQTYEQYTCVCGLTSIQMKSFARITRLARKSTCLPASPLHWHTVTSGCCTKNRGFRIFTASYSDCTSEFIDFFESTERGSIHTLPTANKTKIISMHIHACISNGRTACLVVENIIIDLSTRFDVNWFSRALERTSAIGRFKFGILPLF